MKKNILFVSVSVSVFALIISCNNASTSQKQETQKVDSTSVKVDSTSVQTAALYVCPMHEDVTSNKPGTCSKCGMDLEKKN